MRPPCRSIHNLGLVGHIEDIAVAKDQQGKKLGLRIIQTLDHVAEKVGCYKVCFLLLEGLQIINRPAPRRETEAGLASD